MYTNSLLCPLSWFPFALFIETASVNNSLKGVYFLLHECFGKQLILCSSSLLTYSECSDQKADDADLGYRFHSRKECRKASLLISFVRLCFQYLLWWKVFSYSICFCSSIIDRWSHKKDKCSWSIRRSWIVLSAGIKLMDLALGSCRMDGLLWALDASMQ